MTESYSGHTEAWEMRKDSGKAEPPRDLNAVERREVLTCSPDELVGTTWEQEWIREV